MIIRFSTPSPSFMKCMMHRPLASVSVPSPIMPLLHVTKACNVTFKITWPQCRHRVRIRWSLTIEAIKAFHDGYGRWEGGSSSSRWRRLPNRRSDGGGSILASWSKAARHFKILVDWHVRGFRYIHRTNGLVGKWRLRSERDGLRQWQLAEIKFIYVYVR